MSPFTVTGSGGMSTCSVCPARSRAGRLVSIAECSTKARSMRLALNLDQAACDPRHFEQVVDESYQVTDLTLHDRSRPAGRPDPGSLWSRAVGRQSAAAPADCAIHDPAWPGIHPCADRPAEATLLSEGAPRGVPGSGTGVRAPAAPSAPPSSASPVAPAARATSRCPSVLAASLDSAESAPGRVRIKTGRSDHGGCDARSSAKRGMVRRGHGFLRDQDRPSAHVQFLQ